MRAFAALPAADNPLCQHFARRVEALEGLPAADKAAFDARCRHAVEHGVVPAYRKLLAFFEAQLPRATTDDGVWKLPDGDAYYAYRLRSETTTRMTPHMLEKIGTSEAEAVAEVERYIVDPGQACAYKVGMLSILAAGQRAQAALGPRFDADAEKAFHDVVLGGGALPLEILQEQVDAWIGTRKAR